MQNLTIINHNGNYYRVIFAFMTKKFNSFDTNDIIVLFLRL